MTAVVKASDTLACGKPPESLLKQIPGDTGHRPRWLWTPRGSVFNTLLADGRAAPQTCQFPWRGAQGVAFLIKCSLTTFAG